MGNFYGWLFRTEDEIQDGKPRPIDNATGLPISAGCAVFVALLTAISAVVAWLGVTGQI